VVPYGADRNRVGYRTVLTRTEWGNVRFFQEQSGVPYSVERNRVGVTYGVDRNRVWYRMVLTGKEWGTVRC
jgi:hypothetical protein